MSHEFSTEQEEIPILALVRSQGSLGCIVYPTGFQDWYSSKRSKASSRDIHKLLTDLLSGGISRILDLAEKQYEREK